MMLKSSERIKLCIQPFLFTFTVFLSINLFVDAIPYHSELTALTLDPFGNSLTDISRRQIQSFFVSKLSWKNICNPNGEYRKRNINGENFCLKDWKVIVSDDESTAKLLKNISVIGRPNPFHIEDSEERKLNTVIKTDPIYSIALCIDLDWKDSQVFMKSNSGNLYSCPTDIAFHYIEPHIIKNMPIYYKVVSPNPKLEVEWDLSRSEYQSSDPNQDELQNQMNHLLKEFKLSFDSIHQIIIQKTERSLQGIDKKIGSLYNSLPDSKKIHGDTGEIIYKLPPNIMEDIKNECNNYIISLLDDKTNHEYSGMLNLLKNIEEFGKHKKRLSGNLANKILQLARATRSRVSSLKSKINAVQNYELGVSITEKISDILFKPIEDLQKKEKTAPLPSYQIDLKNIDTNNDDDVLYSNYILDKTDDDKISQVKMPFLTNPSQSILESNP